MSRAFSDDEAPIAGDEGERLWAAFEHTGIATCLLAPDGTLIRANATFCEQVGYSEAELLSGTIPDPTHPDDAAALQAGLRALLAGEGNVHRYEKRYLREDGEVARADVSTSLYLDADGVPLYFITQSQDNPPPKPAPTEATVGRTPLHEGGTRGRIEGVTGRMNQLLSTVLDTSPVGIALIEERTFMWANGAFRRMLGNAGENMVGLDDRPYFPDEAEYDRVGQELFGPPAPSGAVRETETRLIRADGTVLDCHLLAAPLNAHDPSEGHILAAVDVTERTRAAEALAHQLGRLSLLNEITRSVAERHDPESIVRVVLNRLVDELPAAAASLYIHDPEADTLAIEVCIDPSGRRDAEGLPRPGGSVPVEDTDLRACLDGHTCHRRDMAVIDRPLEQALAAAGLRSGLAAPLAAEGRAFGIIGLLRAEPDAFAEAEVEFVQQLSEHVALAVHQARLRDDLSKALQDLRLAQETIVQQERMRALGQMASGIAHDFNNALASIVGYSQLLLDYPESLDNPTTARKYVERISSAASDAANVVSRLREFYRPRRVEEAWQAVSVREVLEQVVDLTRTRWEDDAWQHGANITVGIEASSELPPIAGNAPELREALTNVLLNAVAAMPEGGTITFRARQEGPYVVIETQDTGIGMTEEVRRRCLEPFFTTKGESGTGLGLAMVHGIVQRHEGRVEVQSEVGHGTTFAIYLPAFTASKNAPEPSAETVVPVRKLRVLVIDDEGRASDAIVDCLRLEGHEVARAESGQEGLEQFAHGDFDLVITDRAMPGMNGDQLAVAVKDLRPTMPIIMLTGFGDIMKAMDDRPPAVDWVLSKPVRPAALREAVGRLVK